MYQCNYLLCLRADVSLGLNIIHQESDDRFNKLSSRLLSATGTNLGKMIIN